MIEALMPAEAIVVRARPEMASEPLHPDEIPGTEGMIEKRLREFTLGRACARRALARLGIEDFALRNGSDRAPIWPEGVVGTLTHCRELCAVAVARRGPVVGLGLDAESLRALGAGIEERVTTAADRAHLAALPAAPHPGGWPLLVFSAKEAFYKCYYPLAGTFLGFQDAEIEIDPHDRRFRIRLARADAPDAAGRREMQGRFAIAEDHLVTAVSLRDA